MPEIALGDIVTVKGDSLLVRKAAFAAKQVGSIFIPESARDDAKFDRQSAWRAELVKIGDKVDLKDYDRYGDKVSIGSFLYLNPVAIDCPHFNSQDGKETYFFVKEEDVLGVETVEPVAA